MRDLNKFKGCLAGGAAGDALGYPVEFMTADRIRRSFGPDGITRYELNRGKALISDDTQMSLFTAVGLLFGETRGCLGKPGGIQSCIGKAYRDWLVTQRRSFPVEPDFEPAAWLINFPEFFDCRAPGNTCLSALGSGRYGSVERPINDSKGCGGVMRVAPVGVYFSDKENWPAAEIARLGAEAAAVTHGHELGYLPAAALVHIIHSLSTGAETDLLRAVRSAVDAVRALFPASKHMEDFAGIMERAVGLAGSGLSDPDAIRRLGGGWVAEETLAIAVYCCLKYPDDFEKAVIAAVNHDGDSDSTGAVAGNIMGTMLGYEAIPACYLRDLEMLDLILEVAEDLYHDCRMEAGGERDELWLHKYLYADYDPEMRKMPEKARSGGSSDADAAENQAELENAK